MKNLIALIIFLSYSYISYCGIDVTNVEACHGTNTASVGAEIACFETKLL